MTLPPDLIEGWYWVRWHEGAPTVERIYRSDVLGAWMMGRSSGTVFRARRNAEYVEREGGGRFKTGWRNTLRRAGLTGADLRPHDLRHTCSTWLTMAGVHEQVRDELLGHASSDMGRRYSHIPRPSLIEAVDKLPRREDLVKAVGPGTATIRKRLRKGERPATLVRERS